MNTLESIENNLNTVEKTLNSLENQIPGVDKNAKEDIYWDLWVNVSSMNEIVKDMKKDLIKIRKKFQ